MLIYRVWWERFGDSGRTLVDYGSEYNGPDRQAAVKAWDESRLSDFGVASDVTNRRTYMDTREIDDAEYRLRYMRGRRDT